MPKPRRTSTLASKDELDTFNRPVIGIDVKEKRGGTVHRKDADAPSKTSFKGCRSEMEIAHSRSVFTQRAIDAHKNSGMPRIDRGEDDYA